MAQTYGFEDILIIYEWFLGVGPIYISRPEIIFVDFRFFHSGGRPMARRQGCVWAGRGAHVLGCVVPARRDSGGVFKASVVPSQVWGRELAMCTSD